MINNNIDVKKKKYIAAQVAGKSKREAALAAGAKSIMAADKYGTRMSKDVQVQEAINKALEYHGATPEFAVGSIKKVAEQVENNPGAALNASVKILELHGWKAGERPNVTLQVKNAFFNGSRTKLEQKPVVDGEIVE